MGRRARRGSTRSRGCCARKRQARGALELEIAEPKVVLDADDPRLVRDVVKAKGDPAVKQAYQLVEEFMIAANEAVGSFFRKRNAPTVWRVHAPPKPDRVAPARRAARRVRHRGRRRGGGRRRSA